VSGSFDEILPPEMRQRRRSARRQHGRTGIGDHAATKLACEAGRDRWAAAGVPSTV
jgi:hypothetical protein